MDDDDEIGRLLEEHGLELPGMGADVSDDEASLRLSDLDELGDWE